MRVRFLEIAKPELIRASDNVCHRGLDDVSNLLTDHNVGNLTEEMGEGGQGRLTVQDVLQSPRITVVTTDQTCYILRSLLSPVSQLEILFPLSDTIRRCWQYFVIPEFIISSDHYC